MPPRRKFDKNTSTTFALVHRAQNDPLIHDENAPSMVFAEKSSRRHVTDDDGNSLPPSSGASVVSGMSGMSGGQGKLLLTDRLIAATQPLSTEGADELEEAPLDGADEPKSQEEE